MPSLRDRFAGCIVGQALGDALGFMVEGSPPEVCRDYWSRHVESDRLAEASRGSFRFGQYSDDTQLARGLMESFVECGEFDPADYSKRIAAIFWEDRIVGRGRATQEAAARLSMGIPWDEAGTPSPAAGNGSAMRAGPIGLFFFDDPERLVEAAHDQGRITHRDPRCSAGAIVVAGTVGLSLDGIEEPVEICARIAGWTREFDPILADALAEMPEWVGRIPDEMAPIISRIGLAEDYEDRWQGVSPFVTPSVLWSLYAFLRSPDDYMKSIRTAIEVGGDVDTTAAMTGAMSGARTGLDQLPGALFDRLTDQGEWEADALIALSDQALEVIENGG